MLIGFAAEPLIRISMEQRWPHAIRLKSGAVQRLGETSTGRAEIFALPIRLGSLAELPNRVFLKWRLAAMRRSADANC